MRNPDEPEIPPEIVRQGQMPVLPRQRDPEWQRLLDNQLYGVRLWNAHQDIHRRPWEMRGEQGPRPQETVVLRDFGVPWNEEWMRAEERRLRGLGLLRNYRVPRRIEAADRHADRRVGQDVGRRIDRVREELIEALRALPNLHERHG